MGGTPAFLNSVDYSGLVPTDINTIKQTNIQDTENKKQNQEANNETGNISKTPNGNFVKINFSQNRKGIVKSNSRSNWEKLQRLQQIIAKLQMIDQKVRAHEMAHMAVGGPYAGGATYSYVQGPDGRLYAVAGEVPIDLSDAPTPEETVIKMQTVIAAALAPADPSPQDLKVAAIASQKLMRALMELAKKHQEQILKGHHPQGGPKENANPVTEQSSQTKEVKTPTAGTKNETPNVENNSIASQEGFYQMSCNECRNRMGSCQNPFNCPNRVFNSIVSIENILNPSFGLQK
jgi:hypothetical protein